MSRYHFMSFYVILCHFLQLSACLDNATLGPLWSIGNVVLVSYIDSTASQLSNASGFIENGFEVMEKIDFENIFWKMKISKSRKFWFLRFLKFPFFKNYFQNQFSPRIQNHFQQFRMRWKAVRPYDRYTMLKQHSRPIRGALESHYQGMQKVVKNCKNL